MKKIAQILKSHGGHWVGDGFPVRSLFAYDREAQENSPFLLFDYAGPYTFPPAASPRGVGQHPHRGFETVTIAYEGEVAHRDSTGGGGTIRPGDVQWMTAAGGIIHEEFHSPEFTRTGGPFRMVQLWVNLPARDKLTAPAYQTLLDASIPRAELPGGAGQLRVIAGDYRGHRGPAHSFSPLDVWDLRLNAGKAFELRVEPGRNTALVLLRGSLRLNGGQRAEEGQLVLFERQGDAIHIETESDALALLLSGEPLDEPIVGYGPFVMNSREQIEQALDDFRRGRFGQMAG